MFHAGCLYLKNINRFKKGPKLYRKLREKNLLCFKIQINKHNTELQRKLPREKITIIKAYDVTMMLQLHTSYWFIGNYSGFRKFSFGMLIIIINRFILHMQGNWGNKKRAINLQHTFWHLNVIFN